MNRKSSITLGVLALAAASACSPVSVTGKLGDRQLNIGGTALGWLDETEYVEDTHGGTPVLQDRNTDAVLLHLMFTEAVFEPREDFHALPAAERASILDDINRGDRLFVDVRRGNVIRAGDKNIDLVKDDGSLPPEVLPFIQKVAIVFGNPVIDEHSRYPTRVDQPGSDVTAHMEVTDVSPDLRASLDIDVNKAEGETDGFLTGKLKILFDIDLLSERLAECNFAQGDAGIVDACD